MALFGGLGIATLVGTGIGALGRTILSRKAVTKGLKSAGSFIGRQAASQLWNNTLGRYGMQQPMGLGSSQTSQFGTPAGGQSNMLKRVFDDMTKNVIQLDELNVKSSTNQLFSNHKMSQLDKLGDKAFASSRQLIGVLESKRLLKGEARVARLEKQFIASMKLIHADFRKTATRSSVNTKLRMLNEHNTNTLNSVIQQFNEKHKKQAEEFAKNTARLMSRLESQQEAMGAGVGNQQGRSQQGRSLMSQMRGGLQQQMAQRTAGTDWLGNLYAGAGGLVSAIGSGIQGLYDMIPDWEDITGDGTSRFNKSEEKQITDKINQMKARGATQKEIQTYARDAIARKNRAKSTIQRDTSRRRNLPSSRDRIMQQRMNLGGPITSPVTSSTSNRAFSATGQSARAYHLEQQKSRFLAYGQLPQGFEFVQGNMGRLGDAQAVVARGAMPLMSMPMFRGGGGSGYSSGTSTSYSGQSASYSGQSASHAHQSASYAGQSVSSGMGYSSSAKGFDYGAAGSGINIVDARSRMRAGYGSRARRAKYEYIGVHYTGGDSLSGAISWANKKNVGYQFLIDKDGTVHMVQNPDEGRTNHWGKRRVGPAGNHNSVGISFVGREGKATPAQILSGLKLIESERVKRNIKPENVLGHGEVTKHHRSHREGDSILTPYRQWKGVRSPNIMNKDARQRFEKTRLPMIGDPGENLPKNLAIALNKFTKEYLRSDKTVVTTASDANIATTSVRNDSHDLNMNRSNLGIPVRSNKGDSTSIGIRGNTTVYSPQTGGHKIEGGLSSSRAGPGQNPKNWRTWKVRTVEDYVRDLDKGIKNPLPVTIAGNPKFYGREYVIPSLTYKGTDGKIRTVENVRVHTHDTGSAFKRANEGRFDLPIAINQNNRFMHENAKLVKNISYVPAEQWEKQTTKNKRSATHSTTTTPASRVHQSASHVHQRENLVSVTMPSQTSPNINTKRPTIGEVKTGIPFIDKFPAPTDLLKSIPSPGDMLGAGLSTFFGGTSAQAAPMDNTDLKAAFNDPSLGGLGGLGDARKGIYEPNQFDANAARLNFRPDKPTKGKPSWFKSIFNTLSENIQNIPAIFGEGAKNTLRPLGSSIISMLPLPAHQRTYLRHFLRTGSDVSSLSYFSRHELKKVLDIAEKSYTKAGGKLKKGSSFFGTRNYDDYKEGTRGTEWKKGANPAIEKNAAGFFNLLTDRSPDTSIKKMLGRFSFRMVENSDGEITGLQVVDRYDFDHKGAAKIDDKDLNWMGQFRKWGEQADEFYDKEGEKNPVNITIPITELAKSKSWSRVPAIQKWLKIINEENRKRKKTKGGDTIDVIPPIPSKKELPTITETSRVIKAPPVPTRRPVTKSATIPGNKPIAPQTATPPPITPEVNKAPSLSPFMQQLMARQAAERDAVATLRWSQQFGDIGEPGDMGVGIPAGMGESWGPYGTMGDDLPGATTISLPGSIGLSRPPLPTRRSKPTKRATPIPKRPSATNGQAEKSSWFKRNFGWIYRFSSSGKRTVSAQTRTAAIQNADPGRWSKYKGFGGDPITDMPPSEAQLQLGLVSPPQLHSGIPLPERKSVQQAPVYGPHPAEGRRPIPQNIVQQAKVEQTKAMPETVLTRPAGTLVGPSSEVSVASNMAFSEKERAEAAQMGAVEASVKMMDRPVPQSANDDGSEPPLVKQARVTEEAKENSKANSENVRKKISTPKGGGRAGQNNAESSPPTPGSQGLGSFGRCFV